MKISAAFKDAFRVYSSHFGSAILFLVVEACMTLAAFVPLLFTVDRGTELLALLTVPFYLLLVLWARVNAAAAMRDALNGGNLSGYRLIETDHYGRKVGYGLKRCLLLLLWAAPMIAFLTVALIHFYGDTDAFTLLRAIKSFGGEDVVTGVIYLALLFAATLVVLAFGCAFHSGDRHAFVRDNPKLVKGHHGKIILCWLASLAVLLPLIFAVLATVIYYLPALKDVTDIIMNEKSLPSAKIPAIFLGIGAVLTLPLLPLRSLIHAAFVHGLEKESTQRL